MVFGQLQEGHAFDYGRKHTFKSFHANADASRDHWFSSRGVDPDTITSDEIELEYWRIVQTGKPEVQVMAVAAMMILL